MRNADPDRASWRAACEATILALMAVAIAVGSIWILGHGLDAVGVVLR
jgi:hypothetical protein